MKSLATFATVFGLALGLASAGPLVGSADSNSMCNIKCPSLDLKFKYSPGKSYVYKYSTKTETALEQTSSEKSTIFLDAEVSLHIINTCRFVLKVDSAKLDEEISGGSRKASQGTKELAESIVKNPLAFNFENGVISRICPSVGEPANILNIKRGILSMIQNSIADFTQNDIAFEEDISGDCRTIYNISSTWGGQVEIIKEKNFARCNLHHGQQVVSVLALPRSVAKSSSIINGTQECRQVIKNAIFQSVECHERHVVRPFSRQEKGASSEIHQYLTFERSGPSSGDSLAYHESGEQSLQFDSFAESKAGETEAKTILQTFADETNAKTMNEQFVKLVDALRRMPYGSLKTLASEFGGKRMFVDAVLDSLTGDSMKLAAELVKEGVVKRSEAKIWLTKAALATNVDIHQIPAMMDLLDKEEITLEAHLAISAMARSYVEEHPSHVPQEISTLLDKLYSQLETEASDEKLMATVKAIGNIGIATQQEHKLLNVQRNTEIRTAAIEAFRRLPCAKVDRDDKLLPIFTRTSENIEVRVAAYLNAIVCATPKTIQVVKQTLLSEPRGSALSSFVFTHAKNLAKRSSFNEDVSPITSDKTLKSLELDKENFSKNYFYEMFLNPLDAGFEIDAGVVQSNELTTLMLNSTFDVFGSKVNLFDSKLRIQKDFSTLDGFVRFFGKEILYKKFNKQHTSDFETLLKTLMSPTGWKFTRSMKVLDTKMLVPAGNGLPLTVAVTALTTLNVDAKAMLSKQLQKSKYVAEARSAPSMAIQFEISMMVEAPKTKSGMKMVATASSQWELNGRMEMDLSDGRMIRNIQIEVPRERSDLLNIQSDVYLIGANTKRELRAPGSQEKRFEKCSGSSVHTLLGHRICIDVVYPEASGVDSPSFFLRGPNRFSVSLMKTDKELNNFKIALSLVYQPRELLELSFIVDTPNSAVNRKFHGRLYSDFTKNKFGLDLISPLKKASLEGIYQMSGSEKQMQLLAKIDDKTELSVTGGMKIVNGRVMIMSPIFEISIRNEKLLSLKSEIAVTGNQKISGELEMLSILNRNKPVRVAGEYSLVNTLQKLKLDIDSPVFVSKIDSSLNKQEGFWSVSLDGDYSYNRNPRQQFNLDGKLATDANLMIMGGHFKQNGKQMASGKAKIDCSSFGNFDLAFELLEGRFKSALSLTTDKQQKSLLNAMATLDNKRYASSIRFQFLQRLMTLAAKFELPDQSERMAQIQYDFKNTVKRIVLESDLLGKLYSTRLSYVPTRTLHKISANAHLDKESFQLTASLGNDDVYRTKLDISHNGAELLSTSFGVSKTLTKPSAKVNVVYLGQTLVAVTTDGVVAPRSVSFSVTMEKPVDVNVNLGLTSSGSIDDTFQVETEFDIRSQDRTIDVSFTSQAELSLWQRRNKFNVETSWKQADETTTFIFKNLLDASSWSVDWRLQQPGQQLQQVSSSGTFNRYPTKTHVRGIFESNLHVFERHLVVEPHHLDAEISVNKDEIDFRTEVTKDPKHTVLLIAVEASRQDSRRLLSAKVNLPGNLQYQVKWGLEGREITTGLKSFFEGKWQDETIVGKGSLQVNQDVHVNLNVQSTFEQLPKAEINIQSQVVRRNARKINAEYVFGKTFVKADVNVDGKSFDAAVSTSIDDWQKLNAKARWQTEPKIRVDVEFSTPKYENNVLVFELLNNQGGWIGEARVKIPSMHRGDLFGADLKLLRNKGDVKLVYRDTPKAQLNFELRKGGVQASLNYETDGRQNTANLDLLMRNNGNNSYNFKVSLLANSKPILVVSYDVALRSGVETFVMSRLEARTTLVENLPRIYLANDLTLDSESLQTQHEFGLSPSEVSYRIDLQGRATRGRNSLNLVGKFGGKWKTHQRSVSVDFSTDRKNQLVLGTRVDSNGRNLFSTQWELARKDRLVELVAVYNATSIGRRASLKMKSGVQNSDDSFVFEAKLERDNEVSKNSEIAIHVPLRIENAEGLLKVSLPEEFGGQSIEGSVNLQKMAFDVDGQMTLEKKRGNYLAKVHADWQQGLSLNGLLRGNEENAIVKLDIESSWTLPKEIAATAALTRGKEIYKVKFTHDLTPKNGKISLEAESTEWREKHSLRASYSSDSKSADLTVDIAGGKLDLQATALTNYELKADARYHGERVGQFKLLFKPKTMDGTLNADWYGKRLSTTFVAKPVDGMFKVDLPAGSTGLSWNLDSDDKMAVNGHWTFRNHNWRLEVSADPEKSQEVKAVLFYKDQQIGDFEGRWRNNELGLKFQLAEGGVRHAAELSLKRQEGLVEGAFKLECPWIAPEKIDAELRLKHSKTHIEFQMTLKSGSHVHSILIQGDIAAERVTGTVQTWCPIYGDMKGKFEGTLTKDKLHVKFTSDKFPQAFELDGLRTQDKISFVLKSEGFAVSGNVFTGDKFGIEIHSKTSYVYDLEAFVDSTKSSLAFVVQTPWIGRSGFKLSKEAAAKYAVELDWLGKKILTGHWTGTDQKMLSGILDGVVDFGESWGKHNLVVTYVLSKMSSIKVEFDGKTIFVASTSAGTPRLSTRMELLSQGERIVFELEHESDRQSMEFGLKLQRNGETFAYEQRLHRDLLGSLVRIETPRRTFSVELDPKKQDGHATGRFAWDHGRDAKKSVEFSFVKSSPKGHLLTISIPEINEEMLMSVESDENGYSLETLNSARSTRVPRMTLMFSKKGKVRMSLGNMMIRGEISPGRSEFVVKRLNANEDDVNVGYQLQGKTLSARLNWAPRLLNNYQLTLMKTMKELQKGADNKQDPQLKKIFDFATAELASVANDVRSMLSDLRKLFSENSMFLRHAYEGIDHATKQVSLYVSRQVVDTYQQLNKVVTRYGQRFRVATTVISAITQEISEDVAESFDQWLDKVERSIPNESLRHVMQQLFAFVRRDYETIVDVVDYAVDEYVCEFSSENAQVSNKRCGFVYELQSQNTQHGMMMRLPVYGSMMVNSY